MNGTQVLHVLFYSYCVKPVVYKSSTFLLPVVHNYSLGFKCTMYRDQAEFFMCS